MSHVNDDGNEKGLSGFTHPHGNGHTLRDDRSELHPHALERHPTSASPARIILACAAVLSSLIALFYLEDPVLSSVGQLNYSSAPLHSGLDYDPFDGSKEVSVSRPHLIDSSPEPDSATIDPATGQLPLRKALVISSYRDQNVSWLQELHDVSKGWEVYRYVSDVADTDDLPVANPNGREALPYLTFITDNYATLPDIVLFTHGHYQSWHQPEPLTDKIMALNLTAVQREDYVNLRCQASHGCTEDSMFYIAQPRHEDQRGGKYIKLIWEELMQAEVGPLADVIARPCCAQFAVNKQAILKHSLNFWNSLRTPLETRKPGDEGWRGKSDYDVGLKYEMFWHVLMGKPAMHCPPKDHCENVYFSGAIHCSTDGEDFKGHADFADRQDDWICVNDLRGD